MMPCLWNILDIKYTQVTQHDQK